MTPCLKTGYPLFDTLMASRPVHRSRVQRSLHFSQCVAMISQALQGIRIARSEPFTSEAMDQLGLFHARQVEAACWALSIGMTDADYYAMMLCKAHVLCSEIMMPTVREAELRHPQALLEPQLRAPDAGAHPDHVRRLAVAGEGLEYTAVVDAVSRMDDRSFIAWAFMWGLLPSLEQARICPHCWAVMHVEFSLLVPDGAAWRCPGSTCRRKYSIRLYSWIFQQQLPLRQIARLIASWCDRRSVAIAVKDCRVDDSTVISWYQLFREKAERAYRLDLATHPLGRIGGVVQIDESHFHKAKYYLGSAMARPQLWIFGAIDCETNRVAMDICEDRSKELLQSMICSMCLPGCKIWSDMWRAYQGLELQGFVHETVNHSKNYKDPDTGVHTNRIEGSWGVVKQFKRRLSAKSRKWTGSHVHEWCFRRNIGRDFQACWLAMVH